MPAGASRLHKAGKVSRHPGDAQPEPLPLPVPEPPCSSLRTLNRPRSLLRPCKAAESGMRGWQEG